MAQTGILAHPRKAQAQDYSRKMAWEWKMAWQIRLSPCPHTLDPLCDDLVWAQVVLYRETNVHVFIFPVHVALFARLVVYRLYARWLNLHRSVTVCKQDHRWAAGQHTAWNPNKPRAVQFLAVVQVCKDGMAAHETQWECVYRSPNT